MSTETTCRHCGKPIERTYTGSNRPWRHSGGRPEVGSAWCDPNRKSSDSVDQPTAEPIEEPQR